MAEYAGISREDQSEYAKFVARHLRCSKVGLADHVEAGTPVVSVGKSGGRQREVWHGSRLFQVARRPPKPVHLASPTALLTLEAFDVARTLVTERDA